LVGGRIDPNRDLWAMRTESPLPTYSKQDRLQPANVFLTGTTGYLGIYLLRELIERTEATVHCLVRARDEHEGRSRIVEQFKWYFPEDDPEKLSARIKAIAGDLKAPELGITPDKYRELSAEVDFIYHAAADVRHIGDPNHFRAVNVEGTQSVLNLAQAGRPKHVHYISTTLLGGMQTDPKITHFSERDFDVNQRLWPLPYVQSKFVAERLVREAVLPGGPAIIHRVGAVSANSQTGRFQKNIQDNSLYSALHTMVTTGIAPYLTGMSLDLTPVDFIAAAIIELSLTPNLEGQTFHHLNHKKLEYYDLVRTLQALGYPIRLVNFDEYVKSFGRFDGQGDQRHVLLTFLGFMGGQNAKPLEIESSFTQRWMKHLGLSYPTIDPAWLRLVVQHCIDVGYLPQPANWNELSSVPPLFD